MTKETKKQNHWNRGRLRGLDEAEKRIGNIKKYVENLLIKKRKIRILEIGCGYGKILLELKKIFGNKIITEGINLEKSWDEKLCKEFGLKENIFSKKEIEKNLPKIHILDVGKKIPLKSGKYDLIISQATVQYIGDKALFLEETNRLLTKEGIAIIEMQEIKGKHPVEYKNLFEIWNNCRLIPFKSYIKRFKNIKVKKSKWKKEWSVIIMKKSKKFKLNLKLMNCFGFDLNKICPKWRGDKAVYKVTK